MGAVFAHSWPNTESGDRLKAVFGRVQARWKRVLRYMIVVETWIPLLYCRFIKQCISPANVLWGGQNRFHRTEMAPILGIYKANLHRLEERKQLQEGTISLIDSISLWIVEKTTSSLGEEEKTSFTTTFHHLCNYRVALRTVPSSNLFSGSGHLLFFFLFATKKNGRNGLIQKDQTRSYCAEFEKSYILKRLKGVVKPTDKGV